MTAAPTSAHVTSAPTCTVLFFLSDTQTSTTTNSRSSPGSRPELKLQKTPAPIPILPKLDFRNLPQLRRPFRPELRRSFSRIHGPQLVHARPRQLEFSDFFSRLRTLSPTLAASKFTPGLAPSLSSLSRFPSPRLPQLPVRSPAQPLPFARRSATRTAPLLPLCLVFG
ncbi:hypothetical protein CRG98_034530 [Punica granatum]|uniref:Uncharacterized protein n=1 Tax=Punica granatum TaxID=22663 RepID=A0A2I0IM18_PUNGR|nr:hypothetical protein CRG98_034530 [Punica granatum]